ncbi:MAG: TMEM165/GDT1 family protein [Rickettsiales bacterium]
MSSTKPGKELVMDALFHSFLLVAIGEIGDKTQLLAMFLACRYKRPLPLMLGIIIATLLNHALAAWVGETIGMKLDGYAMQWIVALSFIAIGIWVLKPDSLDESSVKKDYGAFATTLVAFFMAEMGDKTQLVTVALAAEYKAFGVVLAGTTLGMLAANLPAVFCGNWLLAKIPLQVVRYTASLLFFAFGLLILCRMT